jgi:hypothetical protein
MASSEAYAAWIVKNKDKKGTPEFDVVASAYQDSLKAKQPEAQQSANPTEGNSFLQNYHAGLGQGVVNSLRGVGQLARHAMPDNAADFIGLPNQADIDEAHKNDAALLSTGGGMVGSMAGNITSTLLPGMAAAKFGKAIPYAGKVIAGLGEMVTTPKGLIPNIAGGAVLGATQPVGTDDSRLINAGIGGAAGGLLPVAAGVYGAGKFATSVWSKKYGEELAGGLLNSETSQGAGTLADRIRQGAGSSIKGYDKTLAESLSSGGNSDIGLSTLQRAMQSVDPTGTGAKFAVQDRVQDQNKALLHALNKYVLPDNAYQAMSEARRGATKGLYDGLPEVQGSQELEDILNTPAGKKAIPTAKEMAGNEYREFGDVTPPVNPLQGQMPEDTLYQGRDLQMVLKGMKANIQGMDSKQMQRSYGGPLSDLTDHLNLVMPELQDANRLYADKSRILNQSDIFKALGETENKALVDTANSRLNEGQFLRLLDSPKTLLKKAGDMDGVTTMDQALSRTGKRTLNNMKETIRNRASSNSDASAIGSPTAQNLSTGRVVANNMVESALMNLGLPKSIANNKFVQSLIDRPSSWAFKIPEEGVRSNIARSLIDPEHAATLSEMAIDQAKKRQSRVTSKAGKYQLPIASSLASYLTQQ